MNTIVVLKLSILPLHRWGFHLLFWAKHLSMAIFPTTQANCKKSFVFQRELFTSINDLGHKEFIQIQFDKKICELSPRVNGSHLIDLQHSDKSVPNPTQKLCCIVPWLSATSWSMLQPFFWYQDSNITQFSTSELSINGPLSSKDPKKVYVYSHQHV